MVKVLVGERVNQGFSGTWAEFEGEEVSSYENEDVIYTLYKCTAYNYDAYRVHVMDEREIRSPVYKLHPISENARFPGDWRDYAEPYDDRSLANDFPIFLKDIDYFPEKVIDPPR